MAILKVPVTATDHIRGDEDAPVTLLEYGDYECPHCGHAYPIIKRIQKHFGKQLKFVFRNFPLSEMHPNAEGAAEAAEFAAAKNRFWEMHDGLFENQDELGEPLFLALAQSLGLSTPDLGKALMNREYAPRVKTDFLGGVRSGVNGTPTFFINGQRHDGLPDFDDLVAAIDARML
ncbi:MAG: thioredoxin domain-containing protein [Tepidisphaeraceae bacterium]|jgi:protein-disulfide isomerase